MIYINDCLLAVFGILEVIFPGDRAAGKENAHCLYFRSGLYYSPAYPATDRQGGLVLFCRRAEWVLANPKDKALQPGMIMPGKR